MLASQNNEKLINEVMMDIDEFGQDMKVYQVYSYFPEVNQDFVTDYVHAEKPKKDMYMTEEEYHRLIEQFDKQLKTLDKTKHELTTLGKLRIQLLAQANALNELPKTYASTRKAVKKYQKKHKSDNYRNQAKSRAKKFIRDFARRDELLELRDMIDERLNE